MAWESELKISGGTRSDLIAGGNTSDPTADYGKIIVIADGETPGVLNNGTALSGGTISILSGGTATNLTILGNGTAGGSAIVSDGIVDGISADGKGAKIYFQRGAVVRNIQLSGGALISQFSPARPSAAAR